MGMCVCVSLWVPLREENKKKSGFSSLPRLNPFYVGLTKEALGHTSSEKCSIKAYTSNTGKPLN